jgi:hypothetical protein
MATVSVMALAVAAAVVMPSAKPVLVNVRPHRPPGRRQQRSPQFSLSDLADRNSSASAPGRILAHRANGIVSVGLNERAFVDDTYR